MRARRTVVAGPSFVRHGITVTAGAPRARRRPGWALEHLGVQGACPLPNVDLKNETAMPHF